MSGQGLLRLGLDRGEHGVEPGPVLTRIGRLCGGSTGCNLVACIELVKEMAAAGDAGSVVSLLCDSGERYRSTYFNDDWLAERGLASARDEAAVEQFFDHGT